jgi:predicted unusual protein kinase regulating ubiquinone biosynthesis (AarF/ABC1/UbiB family)
MAERRKAGRKPPEERVERERDDERATLGGRMRRYARVGTAVGGLAARLAGNRYLGVEIDRDRHARALRDALGGLKGPLMKVAQIMSTVPDMLPAEYVAELAHLQSNAPAMGWLFVRRRMATELGPDWQKKFREFGREAAAAASLGQVHRAVGHDGADLACKLQYPNMQSAVEADLRQLKLIFALYRRYDPSIDTTDIHKEVAARLREELDYELEAKHIRLYREMLRGEDGVHVPKPAPALSTRRLLTMSWLDGVNLSTVSEWPVETRNHIAYNLFRAWYVPFYSYGVIHGDPHLGNYSARDDGTINLIDFGCIRLFRSPFVKGVIDLYKALETGDRDLAVSAYETWGFVNLSGEVIDTLNLWAEFVYAPLLEDRERLIQDTGGTMYGAQVAGKVHAELRRLGGVKPPREFLLMDRAAIGLGSVFLRLDAHINWHRLFQGLIEDFDVDALEKRQAKALKAAEMEMTD